MQGDDPPEPDARQIASSDILYILSRPGELGEIWQTIPDAKHVAYDHVKRSFATLWYTRDLGNTIYRRVTARQRTQA